MKKMATMLAAAMLVMSTVPAFAEMTKAERDECLLASKNCINQVDDIQKRIQKLNKEIKKGSQVYTADELKKLQAKLTETQQLLKELERPGQ